jgi:hypothetical protein
MFDILAAAVIAMSHPRTPAPAPDTTVVVEEDSPQWDCRYDGNRICGVGAVLPDGALAVPGSYADDNCWPGAVFCPGPGTPVDETVGGEA